MRRFPIGEASRRTDVNIETIRYYERIGILPAPLRTESGRRVYDDDQVRRLRFVRRCRELGFSLDCVRGMLRMVDDDSVTCSQMKSVAQRQLEDIRSKIDDLAKMERALSRTVDLCDGGESPDCPIIEELYPA